MRFRESKNFSLTSISSEIQDFWSKNDIFSKSFNKKDSSNFVFYEGPPSANGKPGIHHVMARTIKDAFCRYKTLKGYNVERKAGWDTHGLPVELGVEKELGRQQQRGPGRQQQQGVRGRREGRGSRERRDAGAGGVRERRLNGARSADSLHGTAHRTGGG